MSRRPGRRVAVCVALAMLSMPALSCHRGPAAPAKLDLSSQEACRWCRMAIADGHTAAQLIGSMEDPLFFDDIGCLAEYVKTGAATSDLAAYVADHRTGAWVPARRAVYTRARGLETPMGSHLIAHDGAASRDADPVSAGGEAASLEEVFGAAGPPDAVTP